MDKVWAKFNFDLCPRFLWFLLKVTLKIWKRKRQPTSAHRRGMWFFLSRFLWVRAFTQRNADKKYRERQRRNKHQLLKQSRHLKQLATGATFHLRKMNRQHGLRSNFRLKIIEVLISTGGKGLGVSANLGNWLSFRATSTLFGIFRFSVF